MKKPTPTIEDYLEKIYLLLEDKGYARVVDIASSLGIMPSSVTRMIKKLDKMNYVNYEKYRGIVMTPEGKKLAKKLAIRHVLLEEFLRTIGVDEGNIYADVEGIEHHVSLQTSLCISSLISFSIIILISRIPILNTVPAI
jgi:Mn-dependent DtxR family transcriptional regulator